MTAETTTKKTADKPRRRKRRIAARAMLAVLVLLVAGAAGAAWYMIGRPVDAPPWLRDRIEARLAEALPGIAVDFGRMSLLVQKTGLARIILWDVEISNGTGDRVAQLSDIEAGLSPAALLRGRIELREAQVSGAFVTFRRDPSGNLGLALGDVFAAGTDVPSLPELIARVDTIFADPRLAALESFEADALTLRFEDQRARRGWTADGGRLRLTREDDALRLSGDVALLSGGAGVATVELDASSPIGESSLDFGVVLDALPAGDIATQSPALAWLDELDAPISGALRSSFRADGALGPLDASLRIGAGVLQPNSATRALPFKGARTSFTYDPASAVLAFDDIGVTSPLGQVTARGDARLKGIETGWPSGLTGQFSLSDMQLAEGALIDRAMAFSGAQMAFKLSLNPFRVSLGELRVTDPAFPLRARGDLLATPEGWDLSLDLTAAETSVAQVLSYWPATLHQKTRTWAAENVTAGRLHDISMGLRAGPGDAAPRTWVDLSFDAGEMTYNKRLPAISGAAGRLTIYQNRLGLRLDRGQIDPGQGGVLDLAGTEFIIPRLNIKPANGEIRLAARGSLTAGLAYLDNEAWQVLAKSGRDPGLATGRATLSGRIALPFVRGLKLPDVTLDLEARLSDVESGSLVPDRRLTAEALTLRTDGRSLSVDGDVLLDGVPATGRWTQPLQGGGQGQITAEVTLSPGNLDRLGVGLPAGLVTGQGPGTLVVDLPKDRAPEFSLRSDLAGIGVSIPQLGWVLPPSRQGDFSISGALSQPPRIDALALSGNGLDAQGTLSLRQGGGLERLSFARLNVGDWLQASGVLQGRGSGQAPAITLTSGRVDLRNAPFGTGGSGTGGPPGDGAPLSLALNRLQITDTIVLNDFRGDFRTGAGLSGQFTAMLGGKAALQGKAFVQNGATAFRIEARDAGDILRYSKLFDTVKDGTFRLDLAPVRGSPGSFDGLARIEGTRLQKAPAIASLLDAVSVVGLIDQMNGPGIFFSEVEARFRLSPGRVVVTESSAVGPSMGISMDGYYDTVNGTMDMQGVLSPIYIVNGIGRLIARKGEGLIGFNFNLRGSKEAPRVSVNPLSVFTPGMFRDIFRRPPPELSQ